VLSSVSPNPFNGQLKIDYILSESDRAGAWLCVYDATGRLVRDLSNQLSVTGYLSTVVWDGCDDLNRRVPSGVYFVKFTARDYQKVQKTILLR
jgi:hypothetical protein